MFSISRYPALRSIDPACQWLTMRQQFGLTPNTLDAYARALDSYFTFLQGRCDVCTGSGTSDIAAWINHCTARGLANATLIQRVTVLRLFFEYLVEEGIRSKNPVFRGGAIRSYGSLIFRQAGPVRRINRLPWIPTDAEWERLLESTKDNCLRDRAMLALAYDAALRREELCSIAVTDFDFARKSRRSPA
jgi:integrase/recombinase XerD